MKKIILVITLFTLILNTPSLSQVTIGPEVGFSYLPFNLLHSDGKIESKNSDFIFGISGKFSLGKKWYMNTRLTYTKRKELEWEERNIVPTYIKIFYKQNDINIDISFVYHIKKFVGVGLGPSIIRKYKSGLGTRMELTGEEGQIIQNRTYIGIHSLAQIEVKRFTLNLQYVRKFKSDFVDFVYITGGKNRCDLTISMKLFGYRKR